MNFVSFHKIIKINKKIKPNRKFYFNLKKNGFVKTVPKKNRQGAHT